MILSLGLFALFLVWWFGGGLYALRLAKVNNLAEKPKALSAALRGPFWVKEMLIWSTIPSGSEAVPGPDFNVAAADQERERSREHTPANTPGAVSATRGWDWQNPAPDPEPEPPSENQPGDKADDGLSHFLPPLTPEHKEEDTPAVLVPEPAEDAPAKVQEPEEDALVSKPKKLPGKPVIGKVKADCPNCQQSSAFGKDAVCEQCGAVNQWLVEKWKLDLLSGPEHVAPPAIPGEMPKMDSAEEDAIPVAVPNIIPSEAIAVEEAVLLPPTDSVKPKKLPGKPIMNSTVGSACPWCPGVQEFHKDAVCPSCGNVNPWLAEKWKLNKKSKKGKKTQASVSALPPLPAIQASQDLPAPPLPDDMPPAVIPASDQPLLPIDKMPPPVAPPISEQVPPMPEQSSPPLIKDGSCPGCGRTAKPDLDGACIFCGAELGEVD